MTKNRNLRKYAVTTVAAAAAVTSVAPVVASAEETTSFPDVNDVTVPDSEMEDAIYNLVEQGAIIGDNGKFKPNEPVLRGHIAQIFTEALNLPIPEDIAAVNAQYSDAANFAGNAKYIAAVTEAGIFNGSDGVFGAWDETSRQQMATVVKRYMTSIGIESDGMGVINLENVSESHKAGVQYLADFALTTQTDDFRPYEDVERAQFATFFVRAQDTIAAAIEDEGKITDEVLAAINKAQSEEEVEKILQELNVYKSLSNDNQLLALAHIWGSVEAGELFDTSDGLEEGIKNPPKEDGGGSGNGGSNGGDNGNSDVISTQDQFDRALADAEADENDVVEIDLSDYGDNADLNVNTDRGITLNLAGSANLGDFTVNAPNATVTVGENVTATGDTIIKGVDSNSFINKGTLANVIIIDENGARFVNNGVIGTVTVETNDDGEIVLDGKIAEIIVKSSAKIKVAEGAQVGTITATAEDVTVDDESGNANLDVKGQGTINGADSEDVTAINAEAESIKLTQEVAADVTELTLPEVDGYTVAVKSSSNESVIKTDRTVTPPESETTVDVVYTVSKDGMEYTADSGVVEVTVPQSSVAALEEDLVNKLEEQNLSIGVAKKDTLGEYQKVSIPFGNVSDNDLINKKASDVIKSLNVEVFDEDNNSLATADLRLDRYSGTLKDATPAAIHYLNFERIAGEKYPTSWDRSAYKDGLTLDNDKLEKVKNLTKPASAKVTIETKSGKKATITTKGFQE